MTMRRKVLLAVLGILGLGLVGVSSAVALAVATMDGRLQFPDTPSPQLAASTDPVLIEQGRYLVHGPAHCAQCHSTDEREKPELSLTTPLRGGLAFAMGPLGTRYAPNLTPDAETGLGNVSDALVARALRASVTHTGEVSFFMKFAAARLSDHDIVAVLSYLRSLEPVRNEVPQGVWYAFGKVLLRYAFAPLVPSAPEGPAHVPAQAEPSVERGRYLAESVMMCVSCHTEVDMGTMAPSGPLLGGSLPDPSHGMDTAMEYVAPNLTNHPTGIAGRLTEDAFVERMRGGRRHLSSIMPWEAFASTTEGDLRSVYRYIQSVPPVDNDRGPTYRLRGWKPGDPIEP